MLRIATLVCVLLAVVGVGVGIITPGFTPKHLAEQSDVIVSGTLTQGKDATEWKLAVADQLKGKLEGVQTFDLSKVNKDQLKDIQDALAKNAKDPVIVFSGTMNQVKDAYMHVAGIWLSVKDLGGGKWEIGTGEDHAGYAPQMSGTLAGGTDMLIRMTKYLVNSANGEVPVSAGVRWADNCKVATIKPAAAGQPLQVAGLAVVEYPAPGKAALFVGAPSGDKLFVAKKKDPAFDDVTAAAKLESKSARFAWLDVNGDGVADLISFDGKAVSVYLGGAQFKKAPDGWTYKLDDCLEIAACSTDGKPGILISTGGAPILLGSDDKGWKKLDLPAAEDSYGQPSACIVADLDNDGFVDILQPGNTGSSLWKGKAGGFEKPVKSNIATGQGAAKVAVGDFNEDGFLDVFLAGDERNTLWENDGQGGFKEVFKFSGSMSYKCPPRANDVKIMDLNHDGRTDLCLAYGEADLLYHFSRGFRCFGEEGEVRLPGLDTPPGQPRPGQITMAVGDLNGDNSQDLAVLMTDGSLNVYFNDKMDMPAVCLRLPKGTTGPVTAALWLDEKFPVASGGAVVDGHTPGSYVPVRYQGDIVVKYRLPGKQAVSKKVKLEDKTTEVILTPDGK